MELKKLFTKYNLMKRQIDLSAPGSVILLVYALVMVSVRILCRVTLINVKVWDHFFCFYDQRI